MMRNKRVGIYLHIPFCVRKCLYCDFCSFEDSDARLRAAYTDAVCREIRSYADVLTEYMADTVFFGGGTPSCLTAEETGRIMDTLRSVIPLTEDVEVTSEVNPATADADKLRAWRALGVNRLSVGVQSFQDTELRALGRLHTAGEAMEFLRLARECGFNNYSLDLMYGIPGQTADSFAATLAQAVALRPMHISAYALKVEPGTPFERMRPTLALPDEDAEVDMYEQCISALNASGYRHYEISNYAKPGYECRHNLRYWRMREYIGIGVAAYSCFGGYRYGTDRNLDAYLKRAFTYQPRGEYESKAMEEYETVMLGLRLSDGIDDAVFRGRFGYGFWEKYGARLSECVSHGLAVHRDGKTSLTDRGMYVSLEILTEILDSIE